MAYGNPPDYEGTYRANVKEAKLIDKDGKPVFVVDLELLDLWGRGPNDKEDHWINVVNKAWNLSNWVYLEKKNGEINEGAIKQLADAFGIDPKRFFDEINKDFTDYKIQVKVQDNTYSGNTEKRAGWMSNWNSDPKAGGMKKADSEFLQSMRNKFASRLATVEATPGKPVIDDDLPF